MQVSDFFSIKPSKLKFLGSTIVLLTFVKTLKSFDTLASYPYDDMPIEIDHNGNPKSEWVGREWESVYLKRQPAAIKAVQKNFWMTFAILPNMIMLGFL